MKQFRSRLLPAAGFAMIVAFTAWANAAPVESSEAARLVRDLASSDEEARVRAGRALTELGVAAVPELVAALGRPSESARNFSIVILGHLGSVAEPALRAALNDGALRTRISAARAIALLPERSGPLLADLQAALDDSSPDVQVAVIAAIKTYGPGAHTAVPRLQQILTSRPSNEDLRGAAADALGSIGPAARSAVPELIELLRDRSASADSRGFAANALGAIDPTGPAAVALAAALDDEDEGVRLMSALGLAKGAESSIPLLRDGLRSPSVRVRAASAEALGLMGPGASATIADLAGALTDAHETVRANAAAALGEIGPAAASRVPDLERTLGDRFAVVRSSGAHALGAIGLPAQPAAPRLIDLLHDPDESVTTAAAQSLGRIGSIGAPALLGELEAPGSRVSRQEAAAALASISRRWQDQASALSTTELEHAADSTRRFLTAARTALPANAGVAASLQRPLSDLERELDRRAALRSRQIIAGVAVVLSILLIVSASFRVRRRVLVALGRRWSFASGECEGAVEILDQRILMRPLKSSQPVVSGVGSTGWPPNDTELEQARRVFHPGWNVRVIADPAAFRFPWAHRIGDRWELGADAIIAGQQCFMDQPARTPPGSRHVVFRGHFCANVPGFAPLEGARTEIDRVCSRLITWGAQVAVPAGDATTADVLGSLADADIVHVAAHASCSSIFLADGELTSRDLDEMTLQGVRCRLLVLSACDAGNLADEASFVYRLVQAGVNVLAAVDRVHDLPCQLFFEDLYDALLPSRRSQGIELGTALRRAVVASRARVEAVAKNESEAWRHTVNSFILYGDPSIHLVLR